MTWGILTTKLGNSDITDGNVLYGADLVDTFDACQRLVAQVYTGTGFDSTISSAATDTQDHEMDSISAVNLAGCNYLKISITATFYTKSYANYPTAETGRTRLKIQTQDLTNLTYTDSLAYTKIQEFNNICDESSQPSLSSTTTFTYYHELSDDEKSNGAQVKIFSDSNADSVNSSASVTNVQTIIEVV